MISQLTIQNYGLIDQLTIDFHQKLNILTGETGAGKSIVIGALRASLGGKLNTSYLRLQDQDCVIEAIFDLKALNLQTKELLAEYIDQEDSSLIIRRVLTPEGRNKIKVNGQAVNISQLKMIGQRLIDFHGPHDHQMLLSSESHLGLLDQLCDMDKKLHDYQIEYKQYTQTKKKINELNEMSASAERELDLLSHQIKELEQVPLEMDKYVEIEQQKSKIDSVEKLNELTNEMILHLDGKDGSSSDSIGRCFSLMKQLNSLDEHSGQLDEELSSLQDLHVNLVSSLRDYGSQLQFNEEQAHHISEQSDTYEMILRKYGPNIEDAALFFNNAQEKYDALINLEQNDSKLKEVIKDQEKKLATLALSMSKERKKRAKKLIQTIEDELKCLGISHVNFEAKFKKKGFASDGADLVEFFISLNAGEELKPLAEIVSSGEAARVMLALKKALIEVDPIPVLIFDEIDAQIGGRLGSITGQKLKDISQYRQVLLITHLPQIASFADNHLKVRKSVLADRSVTQVITLNAKERIAEVAEMMSGKDETKVSIKHAKTMLQVASC